jgi:phosphatidylethanolamine/phosphatidyl-N-methylethanolamine N-methyltransferase
VSKSSFLKQFFKEKKMVGSLAPSSRFLAAKMLNHIPINEAKIVVELGPGTGVFTQKILEKLGPETQLIVIELNDDFYNALNTKLHHPNLHLKHDSADQIGHFIKELGFEKADLIISSLPLANFPSELRNRLLLTARNFLAEKGKFVQFQYSLQSRKALKKVFHSVKLNFTALNLPPAFVYTCSK